MTAKLDLTIAYNGYVIGGESAVAFPIGEQHLPRASYARYEFEQDVLITGTTQALASAEWASCETALKAKSKNFSITLGERLKVTDLVANGTTTVTSVTGGFAASDVGLPLNIEGKGAYQIVTRSDTNTLVLSASVVAGTALTARIGYALAQITPSANTLGVFVRCEVAQRGESDYDTPLSRLYTFRAGWERPADNSGDGYRREAQVSFSRSGSKQRVVTVTGTYTAGGGAAALANYTNNADTWIATVLGYFSGESFEQIAEGPVQFDDERAVLTFSRTYRQILYAQSLAGTDNTSIVRDALSFRRTQVCAHGKSQAAQPAVRGVIAYACEVDQAVTGATGLKALYTGTILPFLVSKCASLLGGSVVIEAHDGPSIDVSTNTIQATLTVLLAGLGDSVLSYDEVVTYSIDQRWTRRKLWDGRQDTYVRFSPGHLITATQVITAETLESGGGTGGAGSISTALGALLGAAGPSFSDAFGSLLGGTGAPRGSGATGLLTSPPDSWGAEKGGKWIAVSGSQAVGRVFVGTNIDGQGQTRVRVRTTTARAFEWEAPGGGGGAGGGSAGGSAVLPSPPNAGRVETMDLHPERAWSR